uniref:Uncharacterized protein n=1 Tax=Arundo donax TaxID=35708 RepID=A0A0A8Y9Y2_ARUDO
MDIQVKIFCCITCYCHTHAHEDDRIMQLFK